MATTDLWIGRTGTNSLATVPQAALPMHVAVVGAAGSGKTWMAKVFAEEAILAGTPVLAIDPQGDLVQFLRRSDPSGLDAETRRRYERFSAVCEPRVFTPGSSHGVRISLSPIRLAHEKDLKAIEDPVRRAEELEGMLTTVAANLVSLARAGGEVDSQQTFVLQILRRLAAPGEASGLRLADVVAGLLSPEGLGIDEPDIFIRKAEREKLGRKLNNLLHGPVANLFAGGMPVDLEALCRPVTPGKVPLNVIYLNALPDDDQKQFFVASLAAEVYRWMVTGGSGRSSLLFYLDEARDYLPAGTRKPPAKEPLVRLFSQGRKYGVACLICTQSPRSVDYNIFSNCSTKLIGRLESAQDVDRVAEWFTNQGAPAWLGGRKGAPQGSFVGRWPGISAAQEGQVLQSRPLFSVHQGAWSPERVEDEMRDNPIRQALQRG